MQKLAYQRTQGAKRQLIENQNPGWGNKLKKKHHRFLHQGKPKKCREVVPPFTMNFQLFHSLQYTCSHVGFKFLWFNTDHWTSASKNRWLEHLTVYLKMRNCLFLEEEKRGKYIHTWLRCVNLFATPRRKHIFVCIYSRKLLRLTTVSRHMQGLKLGPIQSQKQWNGLVLWLKFWLSSF